MSIGDIVLLTEGSNSTEVEQLLPVVLSISPSCCLINFRNFLMSLGRKYKWFFLSTSLSSFVKVNFSCVGRGEEKDEQDEEKEGEDEESIGKSDEIIHDTMMCYCEGLLVMQRYTK